MPIIALPQHLVNRIAAGEVVERPASVVKELLENSLDAGAQQVEVAIEDGGKRLIQVVDNGAGIPAAELPLAVAPHATSKIADDKDLFAIGTFGFRGEALASIAAISHLEIVSRPAAATEGARLAINGGVAEAVAPAAAAPGTSITVRNLFFNTPARRKFLRTAATELGHVTEQFTRIALAHTEVALTLTHNGRVLQQLPAGQSLRERLAGLFSAELAEALIPIARRDSDGEITGLIAPPQAARAGAQWQYVFLNGRFIRDRFVGHAIREAYRGMLEINRQPVVFIFLRMPADAVDVNVHPAKIEVRFADSNRVHSQVLAAIRDRLLSTDLSVTLKTPAATNQPATAPAADGESDEERRRRVRQAMVDFFKTHPTDKQPPEAPTPPATPPHEPSRPAPRDAPSDFRLSKPPTATPTLDFAADQPQRSTAPPASPPGDSAAPQTAAPPISNRNEDDDSAAVVQIHHAYIVTQTKDGLAIIDQHALHERIVYERLHEQLLTGEMPVQRFLIPETVEVTAGQMAAMEDMAAVLADLGVIVEPFGPNTVAVQGLPTLLARARPQEFVADLLDMLAHHTSPRTREELLHPILDMMACKAAVKAGDPLTPDEMRNLLAQRLRTSRAHTCPHGRPTTINLSLAQLEKQFKRT